MLYVFETDGKIMVSDMHPDEVDYETVLANSVETNIVNPNKTPLETRMNIVRNVLANGGAVVTIL